MPSAKKPGARIGRPPVEQAKIIQTRTIGASDEEWETILAVTAARQLKTPMDLFRSLLRRNLSNSDRQKIRQAQLAEIQSVNGDQFHGPNNSHRPRF